MSGHSLLWSDGREYECMPGQVHIINSRSIHSIFSLPPMQENSGYCLQINLNMLKNIFPGIDSIQWKTGCDEVICAKLISQINEINRLENTGKSFEQTMAVIRVVEILNNQPQAASVIRKNDILYDILAYINDNFAEDISNDLVSEYFNISTVHLNRLFRTRLDQSMHQYVMDLRVDAAVNDMRRTDLKMVDIYMRNGFPNNKSFISEFRKRFNMTPAEYKKKIIASV